MLGTTASQKNPEHNWNGVLLFSCFLDVVCVYICHLYTER